MPKYNQNSDFFKRSERYLHEKRQKTKPEKGKKRPVSASRMPETFLGVPCKHVSFCVPSKEERIARRMEFEQEKRAEFIKFLANTQRKALLAAGITEKQIDGMKKGITPHGFNTHHKIPIYGGGTNDFSNLVLIRREPYHDMMHYHLINPQIRGMREGNKKTVAIPDPQTPVFVPDPQYKFLEKWAKKGRKTYGKNKNTSLTEVKQEIQRRTALLSSAQKGR